MAIRRHRLHPVSPHWRDWISQNVLIDPRQRPGSFVEPIHYTAIAPQYIFGPTPVDPVIFATTPAANTVSCSAPVFSRCANDIT